MMPWTDANSGGRRAKSIAHTARQLCKWCFDGGSWATLQPEFQEVKRHDADARPHERL